VPWQGEYEIPDTLNLNKLSLNPQSDLAEKMTAVFWLDANALTTRTSFSSDLLVGGS
jgi:hypothetical protein